MSINPIECYPLVKLSSENADALINLNTLPQCGRGGIALVISSAVTCVDALVAVVKPLIQLSQHSPRTRPIMNVDIISL